MTTGTVRDAGSNGQRPTSYRPYKPASCKLGLHALVPSEYRATVQDGEVHISCPACATKGADHFWRLTASQPTPDRAELDDDRYRDLMRGRTAATPQPPGGRHDQ